MSDPNPNRIRAAHDALEVLLKATFPDVDCQRNPSGHKPPAAKVGGLASYLALQDDNQPEVVGVLTGPIYDLQATAKLIVAFSGKTKDARNVAAYAQVELLKAALDPRQGGDPTLGEVVDYCDVGLVADMDVADSDWMAGGLEVEIGLLFSAPTRAG